MTTIAPAPPPEEGNPRQCGVVRIGGTGLEWVCVREVHAKVYIRHRTGAPIFPSGRQPDGRPVQADRHLFVRRYPDRGPYGGGMDE